MEGVVSFLLWLVSCAWHVILLVAVAGLAFLWEATFFWRGDE